MEAESHSEDVVRRTMVRRAFECDLPGNVEEFRLAAAEARDRQWPDVLRASLYGVVRHLGEGGADGDVLQAIDDFRTAAEKDGDGDALALALAWRGWVSVTADEPRRLAAADRDLARSAVMLESPGHDPVARAAAHFRLAFSFLQRRWWRLADEQYAAAERMVDAVDPYKKDPLLHRAALAFNRVMVQVEWAAAQRQAGDDHGVLMRRDAQTVALAVADCQDMPEAWRQQLRLGRLALNAIVGDDVADEVQSALGEIGTDSEWYGVLHLSLSLLPGRCGPGRAAEAAEIAVACVDRSEWPAVHDLAVHQATILEAQVTGRPTAGRRSAVELAVLREKDRQVTLTAMRALLSVERMRRERDLLHRHANVDYLTDLANRRGLDGFLDRLRSSPAARVALLLLDVDRFKAVNDRFGHVVGDAVLQRVSHLLTENVRLGDVAARFGGDEFVLVLTDSDQESAQRRGEQIAKAVAAQDWAALADGLDVSVSFGVAVDRPSRVHELLARADVALYDAKRARHAPAVSH